MQFLKKLNKCNPMIRLIGLLTLYAFFLTACANSEKETSEVPNETISLEEVVNNYTSKFSITRADMDIDITEAYSVDLGEQINAYTITEAGDYLLSGSLNGSIYIDAEEQIVHLILDGVVVRSNEGPAISVVSAGKVVLTINAGTINTLSDSVNYDPQGEENACIYSVCDLTINGAGVLNVHGYYMDGIHSKDVVKILNGEVNVLAKRDGIRGNDGILITSDELNIESEEVGLHTTKKSKSTGGVIEITSGDISIIAGEYAIASVGDFFACDCNIYAKGILSNFSVEGNLMIQEGCMTNE